MLGGRLRVRQMQGLLQAAASQWQSRAAPAVSMATATDVKPFHYQDILEIETKLDTPWKKLTGIFFLITLQKYHVNLL